ncbi:hypothetical protein F4604DRAFT_1693133 [Suillus subluteus]|nr:hypothetical protein F4604DRAFT_1693133 [Suillus subluteus]
MGNGRSNVTGNGTSNMMGNRTSNMMGTGRQLDEQKGRENEGSRYIAQPYRHYMQSLFILVESSWPPTQMPSTFQAPSILQDADTKGGHNDGAAANWKQKKSLNARSFKAAKNAQHLKGREPDTDKDTDGNNADEDEDTTHSQHAPSHIKFTKNDLPPVSRLMQRAYDYHSDFGVRAQVVIAKHIDKEGWTPEEICEVVAYVTPKQHKCVNDKGETILVNPPFILTCGKSVLGTRQMQMLTVELSKILASSTCHAVPRKCPRRVVYRYSHCRMSMEHMVNGTRGSGVLALISSWNLSTMLLRKWKKIFKGAAPFIDAHRNVPLGGHSNALSFMTFWFTCWVEGNDNSGLAVCLSYG